MQMIGLVFHADTPMVSQNVTPRSSNRCSTGAVRMEYEIARVDPTDWGPPAIPTLDVLTRALSQAGKCAPSRHVSTSKAVMARFRACNHSARDVVRVSAAQRSAVRAPQLSAASFIHSRSFIALTDANPSNYWRGPPRCAQRGTESAKGLTALKGRLGRGMEATSASQPTPPTSLAANKNSRSSVRHGIIRPPPLLSPTPAPPPAPRGPPPPRLYGPRRPVPVLPLPWGELAQHGQPGQGQQQGHVHPRPQRQERTRELTQRALQRRDPEAGAPSQRAPAGIHRQQVRDETMLLLPGFGLNFLLLGAHSPLSLLLSNGNCFNWAKSSAVCAGKNGPNTVSEVLSQISRWTSFYGAKNLKGFYFDNFLPYGGSAAKSTTSVNSVLQVTLRSTLSVPLPFSCRIFLTPPLCFMSSGLLKRLQDCEEHIPFLSRGWKRRALEPRLQGQRLQSGRRGGGATSSKKRACQPRRPHAGVPQVRPCW